MHQLAAVLSQAIKAGPNIFVRCNPEVLDFTNQHEAKAELIIHSQDNKQITVSLASDNLFIALAQLQLTIFAKGIVLVCWNIKNFLSYCLALTGKRFNIEAKIIDLAILEAYVGYTASRRRKAPQSIGEALNRLRPILGDSWAIRQRIYKTIHLPLITTVLPALETAGMVDCKAQALVYGYYDLLGQENGRFRCREAYKRSYIPHRLGPEERANLKPRSEDERFMLFDFKHMEVAMLAWLSQDERLNEIISREPDVYSKIFEIITGSRPENRDIGKKLFLPVIYGESAVVLAGRLGISVVEAEGWVVHIAREFPKAWGLVEGFHERARELAVVEDCFGKRRLLERGEEYLARNFTVQSPASTVCLEKLVRLHDIGTLLAFSVHDAYGLFVMTRNWKQAYNSCKSELEKESALCPGLRLKTTCRAGRSLSGMKFITRKENG